MRRYYGPYGDSALNPIDRETFYRKEQKSMQLTDYHNRQRYADMGLDPERMERYMHDRSYDYPEMYEHAASRERGIYSITPEQLDDWYEWQRVTDRNPYIVPYSDNEEAFNREFDLMVAREQQARNINREVEHRLDITEPTRMAQLQPVGPRPANRPDIVDEQGYRWENGPMPSYSSEQRGEIYRQIESELQGPNQLGDYRGILPWAKDEPIPW